MKKHPLLLSTLLLAALAASAQRHHGPDRGYDYRDYRYDRDYRVYRPASPRVSIIATLPHGAIQVVLGGNRYHYYGGRYYRPYDRGYMLVTPPIGLIIPTMPPGYRIVLVGGRNYYFYDDVYYLPVTNGYQVATLPPEATVAPAPLAAPPASTDAGSYEKIQIDGKTYYRKGDSYYRAVLDDKGEVFYEKVGQTGS